MPTPVLINVDLSDNLVDVIKSTPIPDTCMAHIVACALLNSEDQANVRKYYSLAGRLAPGKAIGVDDADFMTLYKFVESAPLRVLAKGQILTKLDDDKRAADAAARTVLN